MIDPRNALTDEQEAADAARNGPLEDEVPLGGYKMIHLNGTSREELIRQLRVAGEALLEARRALEQIAPYGRDYYLQGKGAIQTEHYERLRRIDDVYEELMVIWTGIQG